MTEIKEAIYKDDNPILSLYAVLRVSRTYVKPAEKVEWRLVALFRHASSPSLLALEFSRYLIELTGIYVWSFGGRFPALTRCSFKQLTHEAPTENVIKVYRVMKRTPENLCIIS